MAWRFRPRHRLYDLGLDYLDRYPGIIRALTREQLQAAARTSTSTPHRAVISSVAGPDRQQTES